MQVELIRSHCEEAKALMERAPDYASAVRVGESSCKRLERECESSLIVTASRKYIQNLMRERWRGPAPA